MRQSKRKICLSVALIAIILLVVCEIFGASALLGLEEGSRLAVSLEMTLTRFLGGVAFLAMLIHLGYKVLNPVKSPFWRSLLISLPAFVIAVNNFPFSAAISESTGATILQGPHQDAQKSTSTGISDFRTSASKFFPVTMISAILFPPLFF